MESSVCAFAAACLVGYDSYVCMLVISCKGYARYDVCALEMLLLWCCPRLECQHASSLAASAKMPPRAPYVRFSGNIADECRRSEGCVPRLESRAAKQVRRGLNRRGEWVGQGKLNRKRVRGNTAKVSREEGKRRA